MEEKLLKVSDVMKRLNISRRTIYYWIEEGIIQPIRLGNLYRFHADDIDRLIASGRTAADERRKKILAVDDDILVRESIKSLLRRAGYLVTVAPDGNTAVSLQKHHDFDLLLTDMRLPGMNGLEIIKTIRTVREEIGKKKIPEIIMTGFDDEKAFEEAKMIGVREFVMKPFELNEFLGLIQANVA